MHALKFCCLLLGARKVPKSRSSLAAIGPFYLVRVAFVYSNEPRNVKRALKLPQIIWGTHSRTVFRAFEWDIAQFHCPRQRLLFGYLTLFLFSFTCRHQFYLLCPFITHTRTFSNLNYLPDSPSSPLPSIVQLILTSIPIPISIRSASGAYVNAWACLSLN